MEERFDILIRDRETGVEASLWVNLKKDKVWPFLDFIFGNNDLNKLQDYIVRPHIERS